MKKKVEPEHVQVDGSWLQMLLAEYRLSSRRPNRKCKVPRFVLAERLKLFWIGTAQIRKLIILEFGYDPKFRNVSSGNYVKQKEVEKILPHTQKMLVFIGSSKSHRTPEALRARGETRSQRADAWKDKAWAQRFRSA